MTTAQIEQKMLHLKQLKEEMKAIANELVEAGVIELSDDDLGQATGGKRVIPGVTIPQEQFERASEKLKALEEGRWDDWEKMCKGEYF